MDGKQGVRRRESKSGGNEVRQAGRVDPDHRGDFGGHRRALTFDSLPLFLVCKEDCLYYFSRFHIQRTNVWIPRGKERVGQIGRLGSTYKHQ